MGSPISQPVSIPKIKSYVKNSIEQIIAIVANEHRTRYVMVFGVGDQLFRTSHPSGLSLEASFAFMPLVPWYPAQSSVPNRVQNVVTESMVQPQLSRPDIAHGLGET
jgi:hypothetical protein